MDNSTREEFILHIAEFLPDRRKGKRGPRPINKDIIVGELFKLFRTNCGWREIEHSTVCRNYLEEIQRRGIFKMFLHLMTIDYHKYRQEKTMVDSSDIVSYQVGGLVKYSGKYHNYCIKMTVELTPDYIPIRFLLSLGSMSDSKILDKMLEDEVKLSYAMYLDKGYEKYERRRELKKRNCQVRMEMKKSDKNRKRGPKFKFTQADKKQRADVEKIFGWLKSFLGLRLNRMRKKALIMAKFIFCLSYYTFARLQKL